MWPNIFFKQYNNRALKDDVCFLEWGITTEQFAYEQQMTRPLSRKKVWCLLYRDKATWRWQGTANSTWSWHADELQIFRILLFWAKNLIILTLLENKSTRWEDQTFEKMLKGLCSCTYAELISSFLKVSGSEAKWWWTSPRKPLFLKEECKSEFKRNLFLIRAACSLRQSPFKHYVVIFFFIHHKKWNLAIQHFCVAQKMAFECRSLSKTKTYISWQLSVQFASKMLLNCFKIVC